MQTLLLETGDLIQIKSTDLAPGNFIKLQPQSPAFLEITDPKAVLENAFRNFSCLTIGDVFSFAYNDDVYEIAVLEVKPDGETHAICTMETDLSVDFAPPVGYVEPTRETKKTSSTRNGVATGGTIHYQGNMAKAINYAAIAPSSTTAEAGARALASSFAGEGRRLMPKRGTKTKTPSASTPVAGVSTNTPATAVRKGNGPQPLRLPHGQLFFGYPVTPLRKKGENKEGTDAEKPHFQGQGQSLRKRKGEQ